MTRGKYGASMTTIRVPQRQYEATDQPCLRCGSIAREPCRAVKGGVRTAILQFVHRGRPGGRFVIGGGKPKRGGKNDYSSRAAGRLGARAYDITPASPVVVTKADGTTETRPAAAPRRDPARRAAGTGRKKKTSVAPFAEPVRGSGDPRPRHDPGTTGTGHAAPAAGRRPDRAASLQPRKQALRVDNGTTTPGSTASSVPIGEVIRQQKKAGKKPAPPADDQTRLRRPCVACLARIGEPCRDRDGTRRAGLHRNR